MNTVKTICLLLALCSTEAVFADYRDSMGSKSFGRGNSSQRYELPGKGYGRNNSRHHNDVSINVIVGPQIRTNRYAPQWRNDYSNRHYYGHNNTTMVFNSSLGFLSGAVVGYLAAPQVINQNRYVREYRQPVVVIDRNSRSSSVGLFKDRYGQCFETESDRYGNETRRRVADYYCNF